LFVAVLKDLELQDWSLLSACSRWSRHAVSDAKPILRRYHRCEAAGARSLEDICGAADVTGLWAALTSDEGPALSINMQLLHSSLSLPTTHAASFDPETYHLPGELSSGRRLELLNLWLLAQANAPSVVRTQTIYKQQALHVCARHAPPTKVIQRVLDLLPDLVDGKDSWESTPLVEAVRQEHLEVVQCLLAGGANPNAFVPNYNGCGDTPLIIAVRLRNEELLRELVDHPDIDLHQTTFSEDVDIEEYPNGKEALDYAPEAKTSPVRKLIEAAITRRKYSDLAREMRSKTGMHSQGVKKLLEALDAGAESGVFGVRALDATTQERPFALRKVRSVSDVSTMAPSCTSSRSLTCSSLPAFEEHPFMHTDFIRQRSPDICHDYVEFQPEKKMRSDSDVSTSCSSSRSSSFLASEGSDMHLQISLAEADVKKSTTSSCMAPLRWLLAVP